MKLDLEILEVKNVVFGDNSGFEGGVLSIDKKALLGKISDPRLLNMDVDIARPGEPVRIAPVKDVIEPRIKMTGDGKYFPGILGGFEGYGEGRTKVLRGCAVSTTGKIVGFQEGVIDMIGPAVPYSPFSHLIHVGISADPVCGLHPAKHEEAIRLAGLKAAYYLAETAKGAVPDHIETYERKSAHGLPRIAIVYLVIGQGLLHDNYFYGTDVKKICPTFVDPNEIMGGAIISGNCVVAADKNTTYDHQNGQIIRELYKRHGVDIDFAGVIVTPVCPGLREKMCFCNSAVNIAESIGAKGIIVPEEGSGNPEADLMMICRIAERRGIRTVLIIGPDGDEECVTDTTPEADAVVNVGGGKTRLHLPKMEKVIGSQNEIQHLSANVKDCLHDDGSVTITVAAITGSKNGLGVTKLSSVLY